MGQEFHIKLDANPSTAYVNLWLNEKNNANFKKVKEEYTPSLNSRLGHIGSGGTIDFTFKALKAGKDTIKIASCSLIDGQKDTDYNAENTKSDNEFIVEVAN